MMRKLLFISFFFLINIPFVFGSNIQKSSKKTKMTVNSGLDIMSRYIWRGMEFGGSSPSVQPSMGFNYNNLEVNVWGAFSTGGINPFQEVDLSVGLNMVNRLFTIKLTDYFFPIEWHKENYFDYSKKSTRHILEGSVTFNGTEKIPFSLLVATNFYGADAGRINSNPVSPDFNKKEGIQYSTYIEGSYAFDYSDYNINFFVGINATAPKKANKYTGYIGETGFYGNSIGVINIGLSVNKSIRLTKQFSIPLSTQLIFNPQKGRVYFVAGISF